MTGKETGYGFAQRHRGDGGGGTSPPCTEKYLQAVSGLIFQFFSLSISISRGWNRVFRAGCFTAVYTEKVPKPFAQGIPSVQGTGKQFPSLSSSPAKAEHYGMVQECAINLAISWMFPL